MTSKLSWETEQELVAACEDLYCLVLGTYPSQAKSTEVLTRAHDALSRAQAELAQKPGGVFESATGVWCPECGATTVACLECRACFDISSPMEPET